MLDRIKSALGIPEASDASVVLLGLVAAIVITMIGAGIHELVRLF